MELSPEGLAAAAAVREAARRAASGAAASTSTAVHAAGLSRSEGPPSKRPHVQTPSRPPPSCTHEVAVPASGFVDGERELPEAVFGTLQDPRYNGDMAKEYPFALDPFQSMSIACLERRESVLVAAHTSAGKTVVAEYAIAMAFRDKQRVIYTSPLKALSNQKFRELTEQFGDVGLLTGDVALNPHAACVVMTTEILRSMIYRGSELLREVAWVVFDEVHYMQDRERGVVWEETIIFLEHDCKMVFLSATLSNSSEFAAWVAHLHKQPCHVVYTDYRPTPLQHYAYAPGSDGLHLIVDDRGTFRSDNFAKLRAHFAKLGGAPASATGGLDGDEAAEASGSGRGRGGRDGGRGGRGRGGRGGRGGGGGGRGGGSGVDMQVQVSSILTAIKREVWYPVIFFSFARKECELYARSLQKGFDFNDEEEKAHVETVFNNAISLLAAEDQAMMLIQGFLDMLKRGIGVHHSGLLPILKELVEILFQEGMVKVLFATETFAMGLNMPAKCVVFTALRKWDGQESRLMRSGEYIQMSGRAGRRGMDDRGICIMMVDQDMEEDACKEMTQGKPSPLISSFRLSYYTLLNLMRRSEEAEHKMEHVIKNSFQQFQQERNVPQLQNELKEVEAEASAAGRDADEAIAEYQRIRAEVEVSRAAIRDMVMQPDRILSFLRPGRLVHVQDGQTNWGWGVVVQALGPMPGSAANKAPGAAYSVHTLLATASGGGGLRPAPADDAAAGMEVVPVGLGVISKVSSLRLSIPSDLRPSDNRRSVLLGLQSLVNKFPDGVPVLDPAEDQGICDEELSAAVRRVQELESQLAMNPVFLAERDSTKFALYARRAALMARADAIKQQMRTSQLSTFRQEARDRSAVLRKLGHIDAEGIIQLKGKAACEITTGDELLTSELMFNGVFHNLDKHQLVALVSCLVPVEKSADSVEIKLIGKLADPLNQLQVTARYIADIQVECKLDIVPDEYVESFKPVMMDVIHAWSRGASFADVCKLTDLFEGSLIRAVRRLDELMQDLSRAATVVGDEALKARFEESAATIRRDVMFAASLYI